MGESLRHETAEWSSPTRMTGLLGSGLKARRVSLALRTTFCSHLVRVRGRARGKGEVSVRVRVRRGGKGRVG